jgi:hypothetical protein
VVLIDDEVEFFLSAVPGDGFKNGAAFAATANDFDAVEYFFASATRKVAGVPVNFVSAFDEGGKVGECHSFGAA